MMPARWLHWVIWLGFWGAVAASGDEPERACGDGPHEIEIEREWKCEDRRKAEGEGITVESPRPTITPDGTWAYPPDMGIVTLGYTPQCEWAQFETWSDWPGCEGARKIGHRFYDGCNWTSCGLGGACSSTLMACGILQ